MKLPSHWYAVALSSEIGIKKVYSRVRFGQALVFWRKNDGQLVVMEDRCPHRFAKLSLGVIRDDFVECPFHGFQFDSAGSCQFVPELNRGAKICVKTYPVCEKNGWIWMWWGGATPQKEVPEWFEEMDSSYSVSLLQERWNTHWTRSIENQLDYAHLPFVHKNSIGRFASSPQKRPELILDEKKMHWHFPSVPEPTSHGESVSSGASMVPEKKSFIEFRFPNIWINRITERFSITLAFVPVDNFTTDLYLQSHQKFSTLPGIKSAINFILLVMNRKILNEDKRVVLSQFPMDVRESEAEIHFPSDRAILHFRNWLKKVE